MTGTRRIAAGAIALLAAVAPIACSSDRPPTGVYPHPNILVIVSDDQRAKGTLGVMHDTTRIFSEGVRFTNAFVTTPLCCPSRATMLTGRYAHNHGVKINQEATSIDESSTVEAYLQGAGYLTALAGKYLNLWDPDREPAYFDRYSVFLGGGYYYGTSFNDDGDVGVYDGYSVDHVEAKSLEYLEDFESNDATPWFLYVSASPPHPPSTPEPRYEGKRVPRWRPGVAVAEKDLSDKPPYVRGGRLPRRVAATRRRSQLRTLYSLDDVVAALFLKLDELEETQDTFAVFISDNGYMWGEHGFVGKRPPYTESIQVPLMLRWPGRLDPGIDRRVVANVDLTPTLLDVAGVEWSGLKPMMDGRSLLDAGALHDELLFEQWTELDKTTPDWASLRTSSFQYVEYYDADHETVLYREYYDLQSDPHQLSNLLGDADDRNDPDVPALELRLRAAKTCVGPACP